MKTIKVEPRLWERFYRLDDGQIISLLGFVGKPWATWYMTKDGDPRAFMGSRLYLPQNKGFFFLSRIAEDNSSRELL